MESWNTSVSRVSYRVEEGKVKELEQQKDCNNYERFHISHERFNYVEIKVEICVSEEQWLYTYKEKNISNHKLGWYKMIREYLKVLGRY